MFKQIQLTGLVYLVLAALGMSSIAQTDEDREATNQFYHDWRLLQSEAVLREMDCTKGQKESLESLVAVVNEMSREFHSRHERDSADAFRWQRTRQEGILKQIHDEILLPHQSRRFEQISLQMLIRFSNGQMGGLLQGPLSGRLKLSEQQIREIKKIESSASERLNRIQDDAQREMEQVKSNSQKDIRSVLNDEQQELLESAFGDPIFDAKRETASHLSRKK